jgi:hypothetical protein
MAWRVVHQLSFGILCISAALLGRPAAAQTTQPALDHAAVSAATPPQQSGSAAPAAPVVVGPWEGAVQQFVSGLASGEMETAWSLVGPRARIDEFDPDAPATFARLTDLTRRTTLLGIHVYEVSPTTLAEDIAADVRGADIVPDDLRKRMMPRDEDEAARANATAAQWLAQSLTAEKGDPLAVVVLWDPGETQVLFILLKGVRSSGDKFQMTRVVFGNPLIVPR